MENEKKDNKKASMCDKFGWCKNHHYVGPLMVIIVFFIIFGMGVAMGREFGRERGRSEKFGGQNYCGKMMRSFQGQRGEIQGDENNIPGRMMNRKIENVNNIQPDQAINPSTDATTTVAQ